MNNDQQRQPATFGMQRVGQPLRRALILVLVTLLPCPAIQAQIPSPDAALATLKAKQQEFRETQRLLKGIDVVNHPEDHLAEIRSLNYHYELSKRGPSSSIGKQIAYAAESAPPDDASATIDELVELLDGEKNTGGVSAGEGEVIKGTLNDIENGNASAPPTNQPWLDWSSGSVTHGYIPTPQLKKAIVGELNSGNWQAYAKAFDYLEQTGSGELPENSPEFGSAVKVWMQITETKIREGLKKGENWAFQAAEEWNQFMLKSGTYDVGAGPSVEDRFGDDFTKGVKEKVKQLGPGVNLGSPYHLIAAQALIDYLESGYGNAGKTLTVEELFGLNDQGSNSLGGSLLDELLANRRSAITDVTPGSTRIGGANSARPFPVLTNSGPAGGVFPNIRRRVPADLARRINELAQDLDNLKIQIEESDPLSPPGPSPTEEQLDGKDDDVSVFAGDGFIRPAKPIDQSQNNDWDYVSPPLPGPETLDGRDDNSDGQIETKINPGAPPASNSNNDNATAGDGGIANVPHRPFRRPTRKNVKIGPGKARVSEDTNFVPIDAPVPRGQQVLNNQVPITEEVALGGPPAGESVVVRTDLAAGAAGTADTFYFTVPDTFLGSADPYSLAFSDEISGGAVLAPRKMGLLQSGSPVWANDILDGAATETVPDTNGSQGLPFIMAVQGLFPSTNGGDGKSGRADEKGSGLFPALDIGAEKVSGAIAPGTPAATERVPDTFYSPTFYSPVGGVGVFFPGSTGFATEENSALNSDFDPTKPDRSLEAEFLAFAALGGGAGSANVLVGPLSGVPALPGSDLLPGRIDLVGITLDVFGPQGFDGPPKLLDAINREGNLAVGGPPGSDAPKVPDTPGNHFPSGVAFTPQVDQFAIETTNRDNSFTVGVDNEREQTKASEANCPVIQGQRYTGRDQLGIEKDNVVHSEQGLRQGVSGAGLPSDAFLTNRTTAGRSTSDQWAMARVGLTPEVLEKARSNDGNRREPIVVAVIDTGVDLSHPELWGQLWRNKGEIPFNHIDDDRNGYIDDVYGFNTQADNANLWDDSGHGTAVAGIIAARWDERGMAGVAPDCRLMIVKALDENAKSDTARLALGMRYAVLNGANIIHISAENEFPHPIEQQMIDWCSENGVLVVAAAGSRGRDTAKVTPAGLHGVLTVGASDENDRRAGFSGWGRHVDLVAPGLDVLSLRAHGTDFMFKMSGNALGIKENERVVDDRWYRADGTSFSAPLVTGVAAALWAKNPELTAEQIKNKLIMSCDDVEAPGWDIKSGAGRLNAAKALDTDPDHFLKTAIYEATLGRPGIVVHGTADGTDFRRRWLQLAYGDNPASSDWQTVSFSEQPVSDGVLGRIGGDRFDRSGRWHVRSIVEDTRSSVRHSRWSFTLQ